MNKKNKNKAFLFYTILVALGLVNTFMNIGILTFVNQMIQDKPFTFFGEHSWIWFTVLVLTSFIINRYFQKKVISLTNNVLYENEIEIFKIITQTDLSKLQKIGTDKVYTIIEDLRVFASLPNTIVSAIISVGSIVVCLVYFFTISPYAALLITFIVSAMAIIFISINKLVMKDIKKLRKIGEAYFKIITDVLYGFKELKLSSTRNHNIYEAILHNRKETRDTEIKTGNKLLTNNLFGNYGIFMLLGIIIFGLPHITGIERTQIISFVVILLFISAPIQNLATLQSFFSRAIIARKRIKTFISELEVIQPASIHETSKMNSKPAFENIQFRDVCFEYFDDTNNKIFGLGPINLTIKRNEVLFIIGGNGSGKSTFMDLLTGLQYPSSGSIYMDGKLIDTSNQEYKDQISAVFTNNHLFSQNYEDYVLEENEEYKQLVKYMKLDEVIKEEYTEEMARKPFSKGQGKRMSLIFSMLENRPIMVLDEWAADQDPHFRKYFYENVLTDLKEKEKTIIAVTHDDSYFKHADRIIKFDYGQIIKEVYPSKNLSELEVI